MSTRLVTNLFDLLSWPAFLACFQSVIYSFAFPASKLVLNSIGGRLFESVRKYNTLILQISILGTYLFLGFHGGKHTIRGGAYLKGEAYLKS